MSMRAAVTTCFIIALVASDAKAQITSETNIFPSNSMPSFPFEPISYGHPGDRASNGAQSPGVAKILASATNWEDVEPLMTADVRLDGRWAQENFQRETEIRFFEAIEYASLELGSALMVVRTMRQSTEGVPRLVPIPGITDDIEFSDKVGSTAAKTLLKKVLKILLNSNIGGVVVDVFWPKLLGRADLVWLYEPTEHELAVIELTHRLLWYRDVYGGLYPNVDQEIDMFLHIYSKELAFVIPYVRFMRNNKPN